MKCEIEWKSQFEFSAASRQHQFSMDATKLAGGTDRGATPKELMLAAICGCTGMDVIGLLKKTRMELKSLKISAEAETTSQHPHIFKEVRIIFDVTADASVRAALIDAIEKSQSLYCGVSAMVAKACPIRYLVNLNSEMVYEGEAKFPE